LIFSPFMLCQRQNSGCKNMNQQENVVTADQIKRAVAAVKAKRPAYDGILDFYEKLCVAQETSKAKIRLEPVQIKQDLISVKQKEQFPLISMAGFAIDTAASEALLRQLCQLAVEANEVLAEAGHKIVDSLDNGALNASTMFSKILSEDDAYWNEAADRLNVGKPALAFVAYSSIKPSVALCARQLAQYLDEEVPWDKGYCPICGNLPALSIFREEGKRFLMCSFCSHEWACNRIFCPFCENREQKTLHYFFSEAEKGYRVDVCDRCQKYIKTIDTREMEHPVYPFVEQISTLHLDMMAQEKGLESGLPLWLQI
jgi:FdhE protein